MSAIDVAPERLRALPRAALPSAGFVGGNVTIPHKEAALRAASTRRPSRRAASAPSTRSGSRTARIHGDNTDVLGFLAQSRPALGAGWERGVGTGAGARRRRRGPRRSSPALLERGVGRIVVVNRTPARPRSSRRDLAPRGSSRPPGRRSRRGSPSADLLVNTTSLGMARPAAARPRPRARCPPTPSSTDIVYVPLETPLLAAAPARAASHGRRARHAAAPGGARLRALVRRDARGHAGAARARSWPTSRAGR